MTPHPPTLNLVSGWLSMLVLHAAGCPIHRAVSSRDGWETMNSALDWSRV